MNYEQKFIEIPFGANDSELKGWEYTIPEGMEAIVKDGKVIVREKESENERIRKWLIDLVKRESGFNGTFPSQGQVLAWLEKQKEQKPTMIQWTGNNLKEVVDFTGKSPRFNEWFKTWEEFEAYVHSHGDVFKIFKYDGSHYEVPIGAWIVRTPDGYNVASRSTFKQQPAEWSEEDEERLDHCISLIEINEEQLERFITICGTNDLAQRKKDIAWLKSLRPSWKPSEEQMEALYKVAYNTVGTGTETDIYLIQLYEQLKALM